MAIRPYRGKEVDMFWTTLGVGIFIASCIAVLLRGIEIVTREVPKPNGSRARWQHSSTPSYAEASEGKEATWRH